MFTNLLYTTFIVFYMLRTNEDIIKTYNLVVLDKGNPFLKNVGSCRKGKQQKIYIQQTIRIHCIR